MWYISRHPDADFVRYILEGLRHGFRIGIQHTFLKSASSNMLSARQNPAVIEDYLCQEMKMVTYLVRLTSQLYQVSTLIVLVVYPKKEVEINYGPFLPSGSEC